MSEPSGSSGAPRVEHVITVGRDQDDNTTLATDLRLMRKRAALTIRAAAARMDITEGYVRMLEYAQRIPPTDRLIKMFGVYGAEYRNGPFLIDGIVAQVAYLSPTDVWTGVCAADGVGRRGSPAVEPNTASEDTNTVSEILRRPFLPELVGKLPRVTCKACRDVRGACGDHRMIRCTVCGNRITSAHIHLDYVGHAAVTDRLLEADPAWTWKPAYRTVDPAVLTAACASGSAEIVRQVIANSPPLADDTGMWIELTVGGVTRLGYATDERGGVDHMKMLVSDGIRNAAMRFGVALDLWSKEDLTGSTDQSGTGDGQETDSGNRPGTAGNHPPALRDWAAEARAITDLDELLALGQECSAAGAFTGRVRSVMLDQRQRLQKPTTLMEVAS